MSSSASPDATQSRPTQPAPLRAEALSFGSGPSLLDGLFPPGSITLLEGAPDNLTAALAVLALRDRPLAGHLHYAGADILALDRAEAGLWRRRNLRYLPRHPALPGTRTALGHLQTETREHEPQAAIPRALDLLDRFDLGRRAGTKTTALPPGAQQALSLATALCVLPRVLLLDDVTADMAAPLAAKVIRAIHHQSRKRGMIVIATSTDRALIDNADHRLV
ncbi:MAG: hypothetical protein RIS85_1785, partial [Pseudomonadota bacterium]